MEKVEKIEAYFAEAHPYKEAIGVLRALALNANLEETYKWSFPTYTLANKNILAICKFKKHFGIWFFNGVFLEDKEKVLSNAQEGKTKAMRHWKFTSENEINHKLVLNYINEAIANQKNGKIVALPKTVKSINYSKIPELLKTALENDKNLKAAYNAFTPYKQKEFHEYIATAKQENTKIRRLEKIIPKILNNEGLNDKYRK